MHKYVICRDSVKQWSNANDNVKDETCMKEEPQARQEIEHFQRTNLWFIHMNKGRKFFVT